MRQFSKLLFLVAGVLCFLIAFDVAGYRTEFAAGYVAAFVAAGILARLWAHV